MLDVITQATQISLVNSPPESFLEDVNKQINVKECAQQGGNLLAFNGDVKPLYVEPLLAQWQSINLLEKSWPGYVFIYMFAFVVIDTMLDP